MNGAAIVNAPARDEAAEGATAVLAKALAQAKRGGIRLACVVTVDANGSVDLDFMGSVALLPNANLGVDALKDRLIEAFMRASPANRSPAIIPARSLSN